MKELESANLSLPSLPLTRGKPERKWTASPLTLDSKSSTWTPQQQTIDAWSKDTTTFWTSTSWTVNFSGQLTDVYESTRLLRDRKGQDVLRFRFLCLFFYDLVHLVFPNHGKRLPEYITQHLVDLISIDDSVNHLDQEISTDVKDWVSKGKRYHTLVEAFGEAVLIQLPVDTQTEACVILVFAKPLLIVNRLRRLPLVNDHRFREAVSGIDKSKLTDEAQTTGREIRDSALQPFRSLSVEDPRPYDTQRASTWRSEENVICHNKQSVLNGVAIPRPLSHRTDAASRKRRCLRPATPNIPCRESRDMHSQTQKDNMGAAGTASGLEATAQDSSSILASNKFGTPHTSKPMAQSEHVDHYRQSSTRAQSARASPSVVSDSALNFDSAIPVPSVVHPSGSWQSSSNPSQRSYASTGGQTTNGHSEIDLLLQTANSAPRGLEGMSSNLSLLNNNSKSPLRNPKTKSNYIRHRKHGRHDQYWSSVYNGIPEPIQGF